MKANTSICLMLVAVSVLLLQNPSASTTKRRVAQLCAVLAAVVGLLTFSEHLFGWNLRLDQLLFHESLAEAGQSFPGRMGVASAAGFYSHLTKPLNLQALAEVLQQLATERANGRKPVK